jgi:aldehyde:ferredoxin oxidoreductase
MNLGGYRNRVARVDLTHGKVTYEPLNQDDLRKYVGGRGLGAKYVFDNGPEVEPLSPKNLLVFMTGPLSGTDVNLSGRIAVCTKSPLTGTITDSHHGGWSGARLKWAGLDGIVFSGKADKPMYALVSEGDIKLYSAASLWGKGRARDREGAPEKVPRQRCLGHGHWRGGREQGRVCVRHE